MSLDREWRWILRKRTRPLILDDGAISLARSTIMISAQTSTGRVEELSKIHLVQNQVGELRYQVRKISNEKLIALSPRERPPLLAYAMEVADTLHFAERNDWAVTRQVTDVDLDRFAIWLELSQTAGEVRSLEMRLGRARAELRDQTERAVATNIPITAVAKTVRRSREWVYQTLKASSTSPS